MQRLDYRSTALPPELEKTSPRMPNPDYPNPATCLFHDFNTSNVMFLDKVQILWEDNFFALLVLGSRRSGG